MAHETHGAGSKHAAVLLLVASILTGCMSGETSTDSETTAVVIDPGVPLETQMGDAILADDLGLVGAIVESGLDLEADVRTGLPSLHYALQLNREAIALALLEAGAAIDEPDSQGRTPLMVAAAFASPEVVRALLDGGADPNAENPANAMATPLIYAAYWNNVLALELLLDSGVDIDYVDQGNSTALIFAATRGNLEAVEFLLSRGADPSIIDTNHNATARDWALFHGDMDIVDAIDAATGE